MFVVLVLSQNDDMKRHIASVHEGAKDHTDAPFVTIILQKKLTLKISILHLFMKKWNDTNHKCSICGIEQFEG